MFKQFKMFAMSSLTLVLAMIAYSGVSPKCVFVMYEPDIPDCLSRDIK